MKIVLVCERLQGHGGWYTYARGVRDSLRKRGHEVVVVSARDGDGDHAFLPLPLEAMAQPWTHPAAGRKLKHLLDALQPDVVHFVVEPYALLAAFLPRRHRRLSVLTIHGSYGVRLLDRLDLRLQACRVFKRLSRYVVVSEYTKQIVSEMLRRRCSRWTCRHFGGSVRVIRNAIELPPWKPKSPPKTDKNILLVGGVKPRKGVLEALEGCAAYKHVHGPHFTLTVAGVCDERTDYVRQVRRKIDELGLRDNLRITGPLSDDDLAKAYERADLYLMPSPTGWNTFEGYGIAFIEANARGVPCIGPNAGGGAEAILEAQTGFRVDARDPAQIADRMHQILDEHRIRPETCRAWAEEHALDDRVTELEETYRAAGA